jgi:signal transduction histidine kinase
VGLGLYIVKHIVEAHDGQVSVTSSDLEGTVVRIDLPRWAG